MLEPIYNIGSVTVHLKNYPTMSSFRYEQYKIFAKRDYKRQHYSLQFVDPKLARIDTFKRIVWAKKFPKHKKRGA